jgi:hypothetical protein
VVRSLAALVTWISLTLMEGAVKVIARCALA